MNINEYKEKIREFAVYPAAQSGTLQELMYLGLGLGEAGEIQGKIKKLFRDGDTVDKRIALRKEIGDTFWYLTRLCDVLNFDPEDVMQENYNKLMDRKIRGVIQGNGDER